MSVMVMTLECHSHPMKFFLLSVYNDSHINKLNAHDTYITLLIEMGKFRNGKSKATMEMAQ